MPAGVCHVDVRDDELGPGEPAKVPDHLEQPVLHPKPEVVISGGVHAEPDDHPVPGPVLELDLELYLSAVTDTVLVSHRVLEVAVPGEAGNLTQSARVRNSEKIKKWVNKY